MSAESKKLDKTCPEPFGGKSGGWVLLQLIVTGSQFWDYLYKIADIVENMWHSVKIKKLYNFGIEKKNLFHPIT